jgi:hypothetical protein
MSGFLASPDKAAIPLPAKRRHRGAQHLQQNPPRRLETGMASKPSKHQVSHAKNFVRPSGILQPDLQHRRSAAPFPVVRAEPAFVYPMIALK